MSVDMLRSGSCSAGGANDLLGEEEGVCLGGTVE